MGKSVESLAKAEINNTLCSPLVLSASHFISLQKATLSQA